MWSLSSNKRTAARLASLTRVARPACAALLLLAGCHSAPREPERPVAQAPTATRSATLPNAAVGAGGQSEGNAGAAATAPRPEASPAASADFARAVGYLRAGNATEAELSFKQIALEYPQFASPLINLGILYRKAGRLDQSEQSLKSAVAHEPASAVGWSELGVTQRMRGEFKDAAASYEQAIAADPQFAPAWRNLGVVSDLYLGDPGRALIALTRYQELTHEEKPVSSWIAELRARLGLPPVKRPEAAPEKPAAEQGAPATAPGETPSSAPATPGVAPTAATGTTPGTTGPNGTTASSGRGV